jgi:hypothetical protein
MNCKTCQTALPDLLLGPTEDLAALAAPFASRDAATLAHLAACAECAQEYASLKATMSLLDIWQAPEVSPYFDQKLAVLLREEQASPAPGWFEQLKTRLLLNTGRQFRPALAGALALLLVIGGGSFGVSSFERPAAPAQVSAAVNDLQILDKNDQALDQMDQLLQDSTTTDDAAPASTPQS